MANRYGEAALIAAHPDKHHPKATPLDRWNTATKQLYPTSPTQQKKGGPRGAFLGLCEEGLVKGFIPGSYSAQRIHKDYAVRAVHLLLEGAPASVTGLWREVAENPETPHTSQMDVVLALWKNDRIQKPA
jgi:hypothetical protein